MHLDRSRRASLSIYVPAREVLNGFNSIINLSGQLIVRSLRPRNIGFHLGAELWVMLEIDSAVGMVVNYSIHRGFENHGATP